MCKNIEFAKGEHVAVAIICIQNSNGEFLIQKTSKQGSRWYSSTGEHIEPNEEPIDAIKREGKEQLGIEISKDNIVDLGCLVYDFPVRFIFYLKKDIKLKNIGNARSTIYTSINEFYNKYVKKIIIKIDINWKG